MLVEGFGEAFFLDDTLHLLLIAKNKNSLSAETLKGCN